MLQITISGKAGQATQLKVMVFDRPHLEIATFTELGLERGGKDVLTIQHGTTHPQLRLKTPGGVIRPTTIDVRSVSLKHP